VEASAVGDEEGPDVIESLYVHRADSLAVSFAES
jgi:hypothetical protein